MMTERRGMHLKALLHAVTINYLYFSEVYADVAYHELARQIDAKYYLNLVWNNLDLF